MTFIFLPKVGQPVAHLRLSFPRLEALEDQTALSTDDIVADNGQTLWDARARMGMPSSSIYQQPADDQEPDFSGTRRGRGRQQQ